MAKQVTNPTTLDERITCKNCGSEELLTWDKEHNTKLEKLQLCFTCNFWEEKVKIKDRPETVRINDMHYYISPPVAENYKGFVGFGGQKFIIEFFDGRKVETNNLWCQGGIPISFREILPNNAKFINEQ